VLLEPELAEDGVAALAALVRDGAAIGLDPVTRQFLLFAWVCQLLANGTPPSPDDHIELALQAHICHEADLLQAYADGEWDFELLLELLQEACADLCPPDAQSLSGVFVSLEGGDGSGKTTQTKALAQALNEAGRPAIATRALGGAKGGAEVLRAFILNPDYKWHSVAEALLTMSVYRETLAKTVLPALKAGKVAVCDRLIDTALVYFRDDAIGLNEQVLHGIYDVLVADMAPGLLPHITFLLDLPYEEALNRRDQRSSGRLDRNEGKGEVFHRYVFDEYRRQAAKNARIIKLDAQLPAADLTQLMLSRVTQI